MTNKNRNGLRKRIVTKVQSVALVSVEKIDLSRYFTPEMRDEMNQKWNEKQVLFTREVNRMFKTMRLDSVLSEKCEARCI